jgi:calcineurin-like phosphoesterase family protein
VVKPEGEIWHLGDFAVRQLAGRVDHLLGMLHGSEHLIARNVDEAAVTGCGAFSNMRNWRSMASGLCSVTIRSRHGGEMGKRAVKLHGYSHGRLKPLPRQFDVGVDGGISDQYDSNRFLL